MGGLWVDYKQMTNIQVYLQQVSVIILCGGNRLGANSLLSAIYGGMVAGPNAIEYMKGLSKSSDAVSSTVYEQNELIETENLTIF